MRPKSRWLESGGRTDAGEASARHVGQVDGEGKRLRFRRVDAHVLVVSPRAPCVILDEVSSSVAGEAHCAVKLADTHVTVVHHPPTGRPSAFNGAKRGRFCSSGRCSSSSSSSSATASSAGIRREARLAWLGVGVGIVRTPGAIAPPRVAPARAAADARRRPG